MNHEESIFRTFLHPDLRDRWLKLLASPKGRPKLLGMLAHRVTLDARFATRVPPSKRLVQDIEALLKEKGAPSTCYLMSESPRLDQKELPLSDALREVVGGGMGTFISCVPGRLGYFEGEESGERYILFAAA